MGRRRKTIGITLGDPSGISLEVTRKALAQIDTVYPHCEFLPIGFELDFKPEDHGVTVGVSDENSARFALHSLEKAIEMARVGDIDALVTASVCKESLQKIGFKYPGHTEYFADKLDCQNYAMLFDGKKLSVALATIHIPLREVPKKLSTRQIVRVGKLFANYLAHKNLAHKNLAHKNLAHKNLAHKNLAHKKSFIKISSNCPLRIATLGLNPHAGEAGAFGDEESKIIAPAVEELNQCTQAGVSFSLPLPPDTAFNSVLRGEYDGALCMYHDQALIPLKLLDFENAVNVTWGLPLPRLSPDHGVALDIAGRNMANPNSMRRALELAYELCAD